MLLNLVIVQRHGNASYHSPPPKPLLVSFCGGSHECAGFMCKRPVLVVGEYKKLRSTNRWILLFCGIQAPNFVSSEGTKSRPKPRIDPPSLTFPTVFEFAYVPFASCSASNTSALTRTLPRKRTPRLTASRFQPRASVDCH